MNCALFDPPQARVLHSAELWPNAEIRASDARFFSNARRRIKPTMNAVPKPEIAPQFAVHNPATQEIIGTLPNLGANQIAESVSRASGAQVRWAATPVQQRLRILARFAELLCKQKDSVAAVISREAGKPEAEALSTEILVVLDTVKYLQNHVPAFLKPEPVPHGNPVMKLKRGTLLREPYGVVGIISPWNYPFSLPSIQTLTALATGNAVVLKPSEFTPYSSLELEKLLRAAGLDPDLLQVMTGDGAAGAPKDTASILAAVRKGAKPGPMTKAEAAAKAIPAAPVGKKKIEVPPMPAKPELLVSVSSAKRAGPCVLTNAATSDTAS